MKETFKITEGFQVIPGIEIVKCNKDYYGHWHSDEQGLHIAFGPALYENIKGCIFVATTMPGFNYKDIVCIISNGMKLDHHDRHTRHYVERELIKSMGDHQHTARIRAMFI